MFAYLISGPSGTGKSTTGVTLAHHGHKIVETDFEPGLSSWNHIITKEKVTELPPYPLPKKWVDQHGWFWDSNKMTSLISEIGNKPVFFVGGAYNDVDFFHHFKHRFALIVDEVTLKRRLQQRDRLRWSDGSTELENVLASNKVFKNYSLANGSILIDSSCSPEDVIDQILHYIN